jgi:Outer membrane protein beta-barrel domain
MKKIILSVTLLVLFQNLTAQNVRFGLKGGLNVANQKFTGSLSPTNSSIIGLNIGVFTEIKFSNEIALQPELLFSMQGSSFDLRVSDGFTTVDTSNKFDLGYINLPVMLKYYASEDFFIEFGPQVGFLINADLETKANGRSVKQDLKKLFTNNDFGLNFGLGFNVNPNLFFDARYNLGLSNIAEVDSNSDDSIKNRVFSIGIGYRFKPKKKMEEQPVVPATPVAPTAPTTPIEPKQ